MVKLVDRYIPNEDVAKYFRAADIVALPYRSATQSGVIPIAYVCDRPVIATRVGGLPDAILDRESGFLIAPGSSEELVGAIREYFLKLGSPVMSAGIGRMRERLGWGKYAEILRTLIKRVDANA